MGRGVRAVVGGEKAAERNLTAGRATSLKCKCPDSELPWLFGGSPRICHLVQRGKLDRFDGDLLPCRAYEATEFHLLCQCRFHDRLVKR